MKQCHEQVKGYPIFSGDPRKPSLYQCHLNSDQRNSLTKQWQWWVEFERWAIQGNETLLIHFFIHPVHIMCLHYSQPWDVRKKEWIQKTKVAAGWKQGMLQDDADLRWPLFSNL